MTTQASERLRVVQNQLVKGADDDIVVVAARRTPICKAKRGQFKVYSKSPVLWWNRFCIPMVGS